ncbi:hypothetical protein [Vacuolonema iberomarrocanum]|uniref:hypothetical protein n=1 Tax=Vacuolonema iberomarrocanum TaxID=3454632 RepID=UPI0019F12602|nr:hypothetical protein [filamentous cyanobacterium LEGE 07170]
MNIPEGQSHATEDYRWLASILSWTKSLKTESIRQIFAKNAMSTCYEFAFECQIKCDAPQEVIDTLKYMTRLQEYDFDPPKLHHALFKETSAWKHTVELLGRRVTAIQYEWRTILTAHSREGEQYLPGEFYSTFKNNQLSCRRLSRDDEFDNVWWLLFPWIASVSESAGFVGYYRSDFDNYPKLIQFLEGKASVYNLMPKRFLETGVSGFNNLETTLNLDISALSNPVKEELLRQAESSNTSLETYISLMVAKKYVDGDILLNLGHLSTS